MDRGHSSAHCYAGFRIDIDASSVRGVTRRASDFARAERGGLCAGHSLLPAQPDLLAAAAPQSVARRVDHREHVAIAPARGGLDFISLDGRVDRVAGLAGYFDDPGADSVGSNRESEADERGACGRVGIDRAGALRLRHAAAQERDKGTRGQGDKEIGRWGDISLKMPLSPCPLVSPSPCLSVSVETYLTEAAIARGMIAPRSIT